MPQQRAHEPRRHARPHIVGHQEDSHAEQDEQGRAHHEPLGALDAPLCPRVRQRDDDRGEKEEIAQDEHDLAIFSARCPSEEKAGERRASRGRPPWPAELDEIETRVDARPEAGPRRGAHEARVNGFSRGQRVARHLRVEKRLENHRDRANPQQRGPVLDRDGGTQQPIAGAQRQAEQDGPGPDDAHGVPDARRRRMWQVALLPGGQVTHRERDRDSRTRGRSRPRGCSTRASPREPRRSSRAR